MNQHSKKKSDVSFTREECEKWRKDSSRNPRTNRTIKKDGSVYKKLERACSEIIPPKQSSPGPSKKVSSLPKKGAKEKTPSQLLKNAVQRNNAVTIRNVLEHYKPEEKEAIKLVLNATRRHSVAALNALFDGGIDPNLQYRHANIIFEANLDIPTMRVFLDHGVNPDLRKKGDDLLYEAITQRKSPYEVASFLLDYGFNFQKITMKGNYTYIDAIFLYRNRPNLSYLDLVRFLIREGVPINDYNNSTLHSAIYYGSLDIVKILLEAGTVPNRPNKDGTYPLDYANKMSLDEDHKKEMIRLLLEYGADPNLKTLSGYTIRETFNEEMRDFIDNNYFPDTVKEPVEEYF